MKKSFTIPILAGLFISTLLAIGLVLLPNSGTARTTPIEFNNNAWVVSWDYQSGLKEAHKIQTQLNSVSYFAAAFDSQGKVIMIGPGREFSQEKFFRYNTDIKKYLTIVNDVYTNGGTGENIAKDTKVIGQLLSNKESRQAHITELLQTVKDYQYQGLEIDYENVWKNPFLAYHYLQFLRELTPMAAEKAVPLRIILEPRVPSIKYIFPEGPEYIIMCYNLFGTHTEAGGPKANKEFLQKMLDKVASLPRPHSIALAAGGCVWTEGKKPRFVTETEARALQKKLHATPRRDDASEAVYFIGTDDKGKKTECWYADNQTIIAWKRQVLDYGVDGISLWRLGGNEKITSYYPGIMK